MDWPSFFIGFGVASVLAVAADWIIIMWVQKRLIG